MGRVDRTEELTKSFTQNDFIAATFGNSRGAAMVSNQLLRMGQRRTHTTACSIRSASAGTVLMESVKCRVNRKSGSDFS